MNELMKSATKFFFVLLAILIIGWTGWHTQSVLYAATKDPVASMYGLLIFEGGMLTWFFLFLRNAESMGQHVVALFGTVVGVILVCIAFFLSMQVSADEIARYGSVGRWLIVAATVETLVFVLLYELFSPKVWEELLEMVHVAMLHAKAEKKAQQMIERDSDALAEEIARNRRDRAFANARLSGIKSVPQVAGQQKSLSVPQSQPVRQFASEAEPPERPSDARAMRDITNDSRGNGKGGSPPPFK